MFTKQVLPRFAKPRQRVVPGAAYQVVRRHYRRSGPPTRRCAGCVPITPPATQATARQERLRHVGSLCTHAPRFFSRARLLGPRCQHVSDPPIKRSDRACGSALPNRHPTHAPCRSFKQRKRENARLKAKAKKHSFNMWPLPVPSPRRAVRSESCSAHGEIAALRDSAAPAVPAGAARFRPRLARGRAGAGDVRVSRASARGSRRRAARKRGGSAADPRVRRGGALGKE